MNLSGWVHWHDAPPPEGALIQIKRDDWPRPFLCRREDVRGANRFSWGLFWKLTGIGRAELEARTCRR